MSKAWMPIYWGDYFAATKDLTTLQHGAYLLLIAYYWEHNGLPTDPKFLRKISGLSPYQWEKNFPIMAKFFLPGWKHKRIETELEKYNVLKLKRQVYGAKGGLFNKGKTNMERHIVAKLKVDAKRSIRSDTTKKIDKKEDFRGSKELARVVEMKGWKNNG